LAGLWVKVNVIVGLGCTAGESFATCSPQPRACAFASGCRRSGNRRSHHQRATPKPCRFHKSA